MQPIVISLPGIPRGKGRPRFVRATGRAYTPAETVNYEGALRMAGKAAMRDEPPLDGALAVTMIAEFPVPASWSQKKRAAAISGEVKPTGKPDADNLIKTLDALNAVVWRDDAQIVNATIIKRYGGNPGVTITVGAA